MSRRRVDDDADIVPLAQQLRQSPPRPRPAFLDRGGAPEVRTLFGRARPPAANDNTARPGMAPMPEPPRVDLEVEREHARRLHEVESARQRYLDAAAKLAQAAQQCRPRAEDIVDLALAVTRELLGHQARVDAGGLQRTVEGALALIGGGDSAVHCRMNPEDLQRWQREHAGQPAAASFVADAALAPGEVVAETRLQRVEATFDARLRELRDGLVALLAAQPAADARITETAATEPANDNRAADHAGADGKAAC